MSQGEALALVAGVPVAVSGVVHIAYGISGAARRFIARRWPGTCRERNR